MHHLGIIFDSRVSYMVYGGLITFVFQWVRDRKNLDQSHRNEQAQNVHKINLEYKTECYKSMLFNLPGFLEKKEGAIRNIMALKEEFLSRYYEMIAFASPEAIQHAQIFMKVMSGDKTDAEREEALLNFANAIRIDLGLPEIDELYLCSV